MVSPELARHLTEISRRLNRQIGVLLGRDGQVRNVIVGDAHSLTLPDIGRLRGGVGRFRGLRLVHTHLKGEPLTRDDLNDLALLRLDLVAMVEVLDTGLPGRLELAHLAPLSPDQPFERIQATDVYQLSFDVDATMRALEAEFARITSDAGETHKERALVVGIVPEDEHFEEMLELVRSAGVAIAGTIRQKRSQVHPHTVVGKGKLQEIVLEAMRRPGHGRHLRHRSQARPGAGVRGRHGPESHRPHAAHSRRLRPARPQPRRQAPGRAGAAQVLAAGG